MHTRCRRRQQHIASAPPGQPLCCQQVRKPAATRRISDVKLEGHNQDRLGLQ